MATGVNARVRSKRGWESATMSKRSTSQVPRPTDAELAILRVLWQHGPSTVRTVHEVLNVQRSTGYTTALKLMQIMTDKGLLVRDESQRTHIYRPRVSAETIQRGLVRDLLDRAFAGAADQLVQTALSAKKVTRVELAKIRELLDEIERGER
jgi:BlaI family transcriptional regulator, penicillinase repressor